MEREEANAPGLDFNQDKEIIMKIKIKSGYL